MKDISEVTDLMAELLENNVDCEANAFTKRGREIINEISDFAEQTRIFKDNKEKGDMFDDATVVQLFGYMLDRIVNAPTPIHRDMSVILIMPFVRRKLQEEENQGNVQDNPE